MLLNDIMHGYAFRILRAVAVATAVPRQYGEDHSEWGIHRHASTLATKPVTSIDTPRERRVTSSRRPQDCELQVGQNLLVLERSTNNNGEQRINQWVGLRRAPAGT